MCPMGFLAGSYIWQGEEITCSARAHSHSKTQTSLCHTGEQRAHRVTPVDQPHTELGPQTSPASLLWPVGMDRLSTTALHQKAVLTSLYIAMEDERDFLSHSFHNSVQIPSLWRDSSGGSKEGQFLSGSKSCGQLIKLQHKPEVIQLHPWSECFRTLQICFFFISDPLNLV